MANATVAGLGSFLAGVKIETTMDTIHARRRSVAVAMGAPRGAVPSDTARNADPSGPPGWRQGSKPKAETPQAARFTRAWRAGPPRAGARLINVMLLHREVR